MERGLKWVVRGIVALFALLTLSLSFWSVLAGPHLARHPRNPRWHQAEASVIRGGIYARGGEALSVTPGGELGRNRLFVGPPSAAHVVGYSDPRFGRAGIEAAYNQVLLGMVEGTWLARALYEVVGREWIGWDVVTTLDARLQEVAGGALEGRKGAIVALDPKDGSVLAMVSEPGFDPERLVQHLSGEPRGDGSLFNRAMQGVYPPGSAFKPVVLAAALEAGTVTPGQIFWDEGAVQIGGRRIQNAGGTPLGGLAVDEALAFSSNVVFASLAGEMDPRSLRDFAVKMGLGEPPRVDLPAAAGRLPTLSDLDDPVLRAEVGIGQGPLLVTPIQMAVVAAAIANGGWRVEPFFVSAVKAPDGSSRRLKARQPVRVMAAGTAAVVKRAMVAAVEQGTAQAARWPGGGPAAGKTGTAENPHGEPHAWFIGFYPADDPKIAVAIVVENGGYGGAVAAPIARELFALVDSWD